MTAQLPSLIICEDHPIYAKGVHDFLQDYFRITAICQDGEELLHVLKDTPTDFLVLDLNLPNIDGVTLLKVIRKHTNL